MNSMMKIMMVATFATGALAAGCQTTANLPAPSSQPVTNDALQAYAWELVDAKESNGEQVSQLFFDPDKPLTLSFMNDEGRNYVAFMNTCNNMSAGYSVINGDVQIKNGVSTLMACPEPQASFDTAALATVQGKYSLSKNANNLPILTIKSDSQVAHFKAVSK